MKLRLRLAKKNIFISHIEFVRAVSRSLRRAGLPLKYTSGYHPRIKISTGPALALGIESGFEYMDIELIEEVNIKEVTQRLKNCFPEGIELKEVFEIPLKSAPFGSRDYIVRYRLSNLPENCLKGIRDIGEDGGDFKPYIKEIKISKDTASGEIAIKGGPRGGVNPIALLKELAGPGDGWQKIKIEKIGFEEI